MPIRTCTRNVQFDAGHRVYEHGGKCKNLHGHRYSVDITATVDSDRLDELGMIVDFSVLKSICGGWIDSNWDHKFLYYERDVEIRQMVEKLNGAEKESFVAVPFNPTAENICEYLYHVFNTIVEVDQPNLVISKIKVWETPNCFAEYGDA